MKKTLAALLAVLLLSNAAIASESNASQLQLEVEDLEAVIESRLPRHVPLSALFEIDITDASAVERRVTELESRLAAGTKPGFPAVSNAAKVEANAPDQAAESADTGPASGSSAAQQPEIVAAGAEPAAAATRTTPKAEDLTVLRDRLRLRFLRLPAEVRGRLIADDRLQRERAAVAEQQAEAKKMQEAAELERNAALQAAQAAASAAERELAIEEARLQSHRAELATQAQSWNSRNQSELDLRAQLLARYKPQNDAASYSPEQADLLYSDIRSDLRDLRNLADKKLSALHADSEVVSLGSELSLEKPIFDAFGDKRLRLIELRAEVAAEATQLRQREADERYNDAKEVMQNLQMLQAQRITLLAHLAPERRRQVSGLTAEGLARVRSELAHVALMARWYPQQRRHEIATLPSLLRDFFTAGKVGLRAFGLVALLIAYAYALRRRMEVLNWLRLKSFSWVRNRAAAVRLNGFFLALSAIAAELLFLALVYLIFDRLLLKALTSPELGVLRKLAYAIAYYQLALAVSHRLLLNAVRRYRRVETALNEKMLSSVRLVARFALGIGIYLILSKALLGRGALYGIAVNIAWVGAALIAYRLIRSWRVEVAETYLRLFPDGRLATTVRDSADQLHGLLVVVLAFAFVAVRGVWTWLRDTALGFEQTRKALAYLLRRRLQRQAERQTGKAPDPETLPEALTAALSEDAAAPGLRLARFPQQDEVFEYVEQLCDGKRGGLMALVGDRGAGKTTWLNALAERCEGRLPVHLLTLHERRLQLPDLLRQLCGELKLDETLDEPGLVAALNAGPARVVMIDLAQNLMLRAVGGLDGYECVLRVARATAGRMVWLLAISRWPFEFMQRLHPGQDLYDEIVRLKGWSEREISELIELRMKAAGFTADYSDLQLDAAPPSRAAPLQLDAQGFPIANDIERPSDRYHRIVWDYADGNPRVALHFWRYSLLPAGPTRVRVRLFASPSLSVLEATGLRTRFLLAALVQHENLSASEAARALRADAADCEATLQGLVAQGVLVDEAGRYRVNSHWNRAAQRFLQRKKLLVI